MKNKLIPLIPPPRTLHISVKAACSSLLFSALGTPSDGVISPTIATEVQKYYQMQNLKLIENKVKISVPVQPKEKEDGMNMQKKRTPK